MRSHGPGPDQTGLVGFLLFWFGFLVLQTEPMTWHLLGKHSSAEPLTLGWCSSKRKTTPEPSCCARRGGSLWHPTARWPAAHQEERPPQDPPATTLTGCSGSGAARGMLLLSEPCGRRYHLLGGFYPEAWLGKSHLSQTVTPSL